MGRLRPFKPRRSQDTCAGCLITFWHYRSPFEREQKGYSYCPHCEHYKHGLTTKEEHVQQCITNLHLRPNQVANHSAEWVVNNHDLVKHPEGYSKAG